jgi:hypothetical protein
MTYTVTFSDVSKTPITINNKTVDTSTSIGLWGYGYTSFGTVAAESFLHSLENFAKSTPPTKPVEGQNWFDNSNKIFKYFDDTVADGGNWKSVASLTVTSVEPSSIGEQEGHFWLDDATGKLSLYYNSSWQSIANAGTNTNVVPRVRYDTVGVAHETIEVIVGGKIVSIMSSDSASWAPQIAGGNAAYLEDGTTLLNTAFPSLVQGINLNINDSYVFNGTATSSNYADMAERYKADSIIEPGSVVSIGGDFEITLTMTANDTNIVGVVSTDPGVMLNSNAGSDDTHPYVALSGRVPVKVVGPVKKGDRLVSAAVPGYAMRASMPNWAEVIGRALTDHDVGPNDLGTVEIIVGVK